MKPSFIQILILVVFRKTIAISRYDEAYNILKELCKHIDESEALILEDIGSSDLVTPKTTFRKINQYYPIAKGGYGFVYANFYAQKVKKVIKQTRLVKPTSLHTCVNEIKLGKELFDMGHPMVVQDCEIVLNDEKRKIKYLAFVMDYVRGYDLKTYLNEDRSYTKDTCSRELNFTLVIMKQIQTMHRLGIMHRDVKPGNVYLETNKKGAYTKLWLIDFGFASRIESDTVFKGTDSHAPPELIARERYDKRIDIFSAGATLFDLFLDYLDTEIEESACNSSALFLIINQMLQFEFKGDNCDEFDGKNQFFANRCRLTIDGAVDLLNALYTSEFEGATVEDPKIKKFLDINKSSLNLTRFNGKGFFGHHYNVTFNEIQEMINRRGFHSFFIDS